MPEVSKKKEYAPTNPAPRPGSNLGWEQCIDKSREILASMQGPAAAKKWNPYEQYALATQAMAFATVGQVLFLAEGAPAIKDDTVKEDKPPKRGPGRPPKKDNGDGK